MDLTNTIIPKSDQLNADDLLAGPRTIKITAVESGKEEQPVVMHYEGDNGRPYKPGKSMRRVLVAMWGTKSAAYIGRRLTLYCDKSITFGSDTTGGIRISHASDISESLEISLTVKRGKRKPFRVEPLGAEQRTEDRGQKTEREPLADLPAEWEKWGNEERGTQRSHKGLRALQAWWATLTAEEKKVLKPKLDGEWKTTAQAKDAEP